MAHAEGLPKYAELEIERRWLVPPAGLPSLAGLAAREIEDRYLDGGRLRLRRVVEPGGATLQKLGKKYRAPQAGAAPAVSIYLSEAEAGALRALPGHTSVKRRFALCGGALDLYVHPAHPFAIFEHEFATLAEATAYTPPPFVGAEVTGDPDYSGFALARAARAE